MTSIAKQSRDIFDNMINNAKIKNLSYTTIIQNATQPKPSSLFYQQYLQNKEFSNNRMNDIFNYNSNKVIDTRAMQPKSPYVSNEEGLGKAYSNRDTFLYQNGTTLFVGGTQTAKDVWDDLKIPFDKVDQSKRYIDANKVIEDNILEGHPITNLVGHSLGGATILKLVEKNPEHAMTATTYGAPMKTAPGELFSTTIAGERYRHPFDPVSMLDQASRTIPIQDPSIINPHSYEGYGGLDD